MATPATVSGILSAVDARQQAVEKEIQDAIKNITSVLSTSADRSKFPSWSPKYSEVMSKLREDWAKQYDINSDNGVNRGGFARDYHLGTIDYSQSIRNDIFEWFKFYGDATDKPNWYEELVPNTGVTNIIEDKKISDLITTDIKEFLGDAYTTYFFDDTGKLIFDEFIANLKKEIIEFNLYWETYISNHVTLFDPLKDADGNPRDWSIAFFKDDKSVALRDTFNSILFSDASDVLPLMDEAFEEAFLFASWPATELAAYNSMREVERNIGGRGFYRPNHSIQRKQLDIIHNAQKELEDKNVKLIEQQTSSLSGYLKSAAEALLQKEKYNMEFNFNTINSLSSITNLFKSWVHYATMVGIENLKRKKLYDFDKNKYLISYNIFKTDLANRVYMEQFKTNLEVFLENVQKLNARISTFAQFVASGNTASTEYKMQYLSILLKAIEAFEKAYSAQISFNKSQVKARLDGFSNVAKEFIGYGNVGGEGIVGTATQDNTGA